MSASRGGGRAWLVGGILAAVLLMLFWMLRPQESGREVGTGSVASEATPARPSPEIVPVGVAIATGTSNETAGDSERSAADPGPELRSPPPVDGSPTVVLTFDSRKQLPVEGLTWAIFPSAMRWLVNSELEGWMSMDRTRQGLADAEAPT